MIETIEHNNRFYTNEKGEIKTENEMLKEWLIIANEEIERLNNIINSIDTRLIEMGIDDEMLDVCEMYDVNGIELRKMIKKLKGSDK